MIRPATPADLALVLLTMVLFSSGFIAIKLGVDTFGPTWLTALRCVIGLAIILPLAIWTRAALPRERSSWTLIVIVCLLNIVAPFLLISRAAEQISAGEVSLIIGITPLFALVGSHIATADDKFTWGKIAGIGLGICGVMVVVGRDAILGLGGNLQAQGETLLSAICFATSGVLLRRLDAVPILALSAAMFSIATPILIVVALLFEGPLPDLLGAPPEDQLALLWLGAVPTVFGYLLRYYLIRTVGYSYVALGVNLVPAIGVGLGALILGEPITWYVALAVGLVLAGLFLARLAGGRGVRSAARAGET